MADLLRQIALSAKLVELQLGRGPVLVDRTSYIIWQVAVEEILASAKPPPMPPIPSALDMFGPEQEREPETVE